MIQATAVLFDLGGTLFAHLESTTSAANLLAAVDQLNMQLSSRRLPPLDGERFVHRYRQIRRSEELRRLQEPFFLHRDLVLGSFQASVRDVAPMNVPQALMQDAAQAFCAMQQQSVVQRLQPQADMFLTLQALQRLKLPMGIVSNIDEDYLQPLSRKHELDAYFDFCLSSERARCCKPHQGIFDEALALLGVDSPSGVIFVGDSQPHDVAGANRAGMQSVWLAPTGSSVGEGAEPRYRIGNLSELLAVLDSGSMRLN